jgi:hypothetical protein
VSASLKRPTQRPSLDRGTVVTLSTIRWERAFKPFKGDGSIEIRAKDANSAVVVKVQIVTDAVSEKASSWTTTAGRGFPA